MACPGDLLCGAPNVKLIMKEVQLQRGDPKQLQREDKRLLRGKVQQ